MPFLTLILVTNLLATDIPNRQVESSWAALTAADHYRGSWKFVTDDGFSLTGDRIVANTQDYFPRIYGSSYLSSRAIFFVSSTSSAMCAVDADRPDRVYCNPTGPDVDVSDSSPITLPRGATRLDRVRCVPNGSNCWMVPAGSLTYDVKPATPTLAEEELLFQRTSGKTLASWLGASATRTQGVLELRWTFDDHTFITETPPAATHSAAPVGRLATEHPFGPQTYAREVVRRQAVLRIGPAPTQTTLTARELERFVEDCQSHGGGGCSPPQPTCTRRGLAPQQRVNARAQQAK